MSSLCNSFRSLIIRRHLQSKGAAVDPTLLIRKNAKFHFSRQFKKVEIGRRVTIAEGAQIFIGEHGELLLGDDVFIGRNTTIIANRSVRIGAHTQIAHGCTLVDSDHLFADSGKNITDQGMCSEPIHLGTNCWIAAHACVLKGVTLHSRVVVGAGAIVTQNSECPGVLVGNPAKMIRRFS